MWNWNHLKPRPAYPASGDSIDADFGFNLYASGGTLRGHRLAVDLATPVYSAAGWPAAAHQMAGEQPIGNMNFDGIVTPQLSLPLTDDGTRWSLAFGSAVLLCILGLLLLSQYGWAPPSPALRSEPIIVHLLPEVPPSPVVAPAPAPAQPKPESRKPAPLKPKLKAKPRLPVATQPSKLIPRPQPPAPTVSPTESASASAPLNLPMDSAEKPAISAAAQPPEGGGRASGPAPAAGVDDTPAAYLSGTPPVYPEQARRRGWEGTVLLRVQLDANGIVQGVTILQSSGYSVLDQAAASQISRWRFKPSLHNGTPQSSTLRIPVKFRLEKS